MIDWLTDYESWKMRKRDKAFLKHLKSDCEHFEEPDNIFCPWSWYFLDVKTQGLSVEILPSEFENIKRQKEIDERIAKIVVPLKHVKYRRLNDSYNRINQSKLPRPNNSGCK